MHTNSSTARNFLCPFTFVADKIPRRTCRCGMIDKSLCEQKVERLPHSEQKQRHITEFRTSQPQSLSQPPSQRCRGNAPDGLPLFPSDVKLKIASHTASSASHFPETHLASGSNTNAGEPHPCPLSLQDSERSASSERILCRNVPRAKTSASSSSTLALKD